MLLAQLFIQHIQERQSLPNEIVIMQDFLLTMRQDNRREPICNNHSRHLTKFTLHSPNQSIDRKILQALRQKQDLAKMLVDDYRKREIHSETNRPRM